MKANELMKEVSNTTPLAILPIKLEKPIKAIVKLASLSDIPTSPIISGKYIYGKYCVKSPNKFAMHNSVNSGFLNGE